MPERSGLPSGALGTGAVRLGLPSEVRGIPGVGWLIHCALATAANQLVARIISRRILTDHTMAENRIVDRVRIDKWLWAARFFKTRSLAGRSCELGRIEANGAGAKPAREVRIGDMLRVKNDSGDFQVEVLALSEIRGPAAVAQTLYRETDASRELRLKLAEERKSMPHFESSREGKPSKRDRREIGRLRGRV